MSDTGAAERLEKFCVKFYVVEPDRVNLSDLIPVFHRWIQQDAVDGLLIDVADYSHVPHGPGVVLIGHEADYFMDGAEGPLGLLYNRKRMGQGSGRDRLRVALRNVLHACHLLEREDGLGLRFDTSRLRFVANDRLALPNSEASLAAIRPDLDAVLGVLYPGEVPRVERDTEDERTRLTLAISTAGSADVKTLLDRIG